MLIEGNINSNKTDILIENYARLLNSGIKSDKILVIVQNSKMKEEFIEKTKKLLNINALTNFKVYTFFGLCYNFVLENYPVLENKINCGKTEIIPFCSGLEASRNIFKNAIDKIQFKGYNSKTNLLHQLLRRQSLITLNALNDEEVHSRTKILSESFSLEIKNAINMYKQKTLEYRAFDYLRQVQLFSFLYKNTKNLFEYVFLDDADEIVPALFEYLKYIKNEIKEFFIAYDKKGCSRKGYLCAFETNFEAFLGEIPVTLKKNEQADLIFEKIKEGKPVKIENLIEKDYIRLDLMYDDLIEHVNSLINKGVKPCEILIIIPENNDFIKFYLNKLNAKINFITGSEKIEENKTVSNLISILDILIQPIGFKISSYKLKGLLGQVLKVDLNTIIKITTEYDSDFNCLSLFEILEKYEDFGEIREFLQLKDEIKDEKLSFMLYKLSEAFCKDDIIKINQFLKQLKDFENIFKDEISRQDILFNLKNTIISENPLFDEQLAQNAINISTIQKAIDLKLKNNYLFLSDTTNSAYTKQDTGPLYNAWVFSKNWIKKEFTIEDNINLANDKLARQLRKLFLLSTGDIYSYSSVYNFLGIENFKGIKHFFKNTKEQTPPKFKIVPRPDQKPVLDYEKGRYAVMAVAGAGKTTIMLALIIKLLEKGVKPDNIFVLTYMDSAARTFKERIKTAYPDLSELPNISTIHGLCMRILRENNNHAHLGLDVDFDIIDEIKRGKLISEILYNEGLDLSFLQSYDRGISAYKNSPHKNENSLKPTFKRVYSQYQKSLKSLNLIDYDDLLIYALDLLKMNSKVREYYQNLANFVIEDEAQDSSPVQQELINIISKKYGNVIRCGDINQAITSTFTNSDIKGFKKFIELNPNCKMNYTARNSTGVIDLANKLIKKGIKISPEAFYEIETKPVKNINIFDPNAYTIKIFEKEQEEKSFILDEIHKIYETEKNATIGILTRTNKEAELWAEYIKSYNPEYKITTSSSLGSNAVFKTILGVFNIISNPLNNNFIKDFLKNMIEYGFYYQDISLLNENFETSFILSNNENYSIWWDLRYFLELTSYSVFEAAFKIGEFYFLNDKSKKINIAPVCSLISKIYNSEKTFEDVLNKMNELKKRPIGNNIKLFDEEEKKEGFEIKIMTLHKSKGDEFDYVFIPSLTGNNMGLSLNEINIKESSKILENIKNSKKTEEELKKEIMNENFRLLYVGITRAKKKLALTSAMEYKIYGKKQKINISSMFEILKGEN